MTNTLKLAAFNARKEEVEAKLNEARELFNKLGYDVLYEFGHCEKMHDLKLTLNGLIDEFENSPLEETDFPEEFGLQEPADDRSEKLDEEEKYL